MSVCLSDDQVSALFELEDAGALATADQLTRLIPRLPAGHIERRYAEGVLDGLKMQTPAGWSERMVADPDGYGSAYWAGWTRAGDRAFSGRR